ncbi:MAG: sodium:solute symporter family protein [Pseudomonadota bacterium]
MTLDTGGMALVLVYMLSLLAIGFWARRARQESSLKDYYLAGGSLGSVGLFFTLYATQYSGNSFFALPGKAYRDGMLAGAFIFGVMGIVLVYQLYAPRMKTLADEQRFISVGDFISWRYRSDALLLAVNLVLALTLVTFILGNLKAIGLLLVSVSGGLLTFAPAVLLVCLIMAIYEALGGLRGVVWTDTVQGLMLMGGSLLVFLFLQATSQGADIAEPNRLLEAGIGFFAQPLAASQFVSLVLLIALGAAMYPQAIQRIYAARDVRTLQRSYRLMFFMPLVTTLPLFLIGMSAAQWFPGLDRAGSEQVVIRAIDTLLYDQPGLGWLMALYIGAAIAAIMSTIDSALLTLGSIISKDIIMKRRPTLDDAGLHRFSRRLTWVLMALMAVLAITLPQTIWALLVLKLELVIQVFPAIVFGLRSSRLQAAPVLAGLLAGCTTAALLRISPDWGGFWGVQDGLWAFAVNLIVLISLQSRMSRRA